MLLGFRNLNIVNLAEETPRSPGWFVQGKAYPCTEDMLPRVTSANAETELHNLWEWGTGFALSPKKRKRKKKERNLNIVISPEATVKILIN